MDWVDHLLNLAGLLLWLGFRGVGFQRPDDRLTARTLRRPESGFKLSFGVPLLLLLTLRSWIYWRAGLHLDWVPRLNLGVVAIPFNSALLGRMCLFSFCSFLLAWAVFYCCLGYLCLVSYDDRGKNVWAAGVARQLGWYGRSPVFFKIAVPWTLAAIVWYFAYPGLVALEVALPHAWPGTVWQQGFTVGAMSLVAWKFAIVPCLIIHFVQSYAYLGRGPFLDFVNGAADRTMRVFRWAPLRFGQLDFAPAVLATLVLVASWWAQLWLERLFHQLPL